MNTQQPRPLSKKRVLWISGWLAACAGAVLLAVREVTGWAGAGQIALFLLAMGGIWLLASLFASSEPLRASQRRYLREFFPGILGYLILVLAFKPLLGLVEQPVLRAGIALLPVVPMVFVVRAMVRKLLDGDELERRMQLEAVSIASITVGLLSFAAAFLEVAGVFHLDEALMLVLPALFLAYGMALFWVRRRYQGP